MSADPNTPPVVVIILTVNQRDKTVRCLSSFCGVRSPIFQTLVWDNGSLDGTAEAVQKAFPEAYFHHHPENLGVASGRNAAAELAIRTFDPSYLLFIDNDMVVSPGFLEALLEPFKHDKKLAQTQAKLRFLHDNQRINDGGGCKIQFWLGRTTPVGFGEIDRGQYDKPIKCISCGGAMMVRAEVFRQMGGFDPKFDPFGPEDLDFSLRVAEAGYFSLYVPQALVFHEVSHSFEGGGYTENYARHKTRHWFAFMRRHASAAQQLGFVLIGAPYGLARALLREGRSGNLTALRGMARGAVDFFLSLLRVKSLPERRRAKSGK